MSFPKPTFSKNRLNIAGETLKFANTKDMDTLIEAIQILGEWRACHGYPINTFQSTLRSRLKKIDPAAIVGQRLKRTPSIVSKLRRFNSMKLSQMQDIGGLRAIVKDIPSVKQLLKLYGDKKLLQHEIVNFKDYIEAPKADGYRSVHVVFKYKNLVEPAYDGFQIELQIRTKLQHAWATAVEAMGIYLNQSLKSNQGEHMWLEFFKVIGCLFSLSETGTHTPGFEKMKVDEIVQLAKKLEKETRGLTLLEQFNGATTTIIDTTSRSGGYSIVVYDSKEKKTTVHSYARDNLDAATLKYIELEQVNEKEHLLDVVLVAAGSLANLKKAYPNYFLDTSEFITKTKELIGE